MMPAPEEDANWTVARAKAKLSEVIERAQSSPQTVTRNGKPSVVVVSAEEWQRKTTRKGTLADFMLASPLRETDLDVERQRDESRPAAVRLLLDTDVLSEVRKPVPDARVLSWLDKLDEDRAFISVMSIAKIRRHRPH